MNLLNSIIHLTEISAALLILSFMGFIYFMMLLRSTVPAIIMGAAAGALLTFLAFSPLF